MAVRNRPRLHPRRPGHPPTHLTHRVAAASAIKALQGHSARWRLRVGDHRIVYTVEQGHLIVWVLAVGNRRDIHRSL
ncbi:type II toxin-antitoxin system RelE family toxin [Embleya hyalina]|uniref:type II toxin-antitoxin system RelE family toxin n=1 Tax=Embleya hyalina TaxID=516124 RepID=UPI000F82BBC3|nr:type II toxin-antitoxin system RelE/ParE family toxin [Embleya hyalina]